MPLQSHAGVTSCRSLLFDSCRSVIGAEGVLFGLVDNRWRFISPGGHHDPDPKHSANSARGRINARHTTDIFVLINADQIAPIMGRPFHNCLELLASPSAFWSVPLAGFKETPDVRPEELALRGIFLGFRLKAEENQ